MRDKMKTVKPNDNNKPRKSRAIPLEVKKIHSAVVNKGGRPTKFTDDVKSKILAAIRGGNYIETAAAWAGVNKTTLYAWLKQGAAEEAGDYRRFSDAVAEALAHAEVADLACVGDSAKRGNWQAAAWRLERRNSARWGRKDSLTVGAKDLKTKTTEELIELLNSVRN